MREAGVEPAWPGRRILSPVRLPVPPLSPDGGQTNKRAGDPQQGGSQPLHDTEKRDAVRLFALLHFHAEAFPAYAFADTFSGKAFP